MDKKITDEANAVIDEVENMDDRKAIVVYNPGWHKGVIGIVASRLTESITVRRSFLPNRPS